MNQPIEAPTWFTSDLHLGHKNIIKHCQRPFNDVEEMDAALIENWNSVVDEEDEIWVVGDFSLGSVKTVEMVKELRGKITLIAGNHDKCWMKEDTPPPFQVQKYLNAGFANIWQDTVNCLLGGIPVQVGHLPYKTKNFKDNRYDDRKPEDTGGWLLHGHVHTAWQIRDKMINVGVDAWDFYPVSAATLLNLIITTEQKGKGNYE